VRTTQAILLLALLGCSPALADTLSDIRSVRTLAAEAGEVIRLQAQQKVTDIYARTMKDAAREQLAQEAQDAKAPQVRKIAGQAISALDRNDAGALSAIAQQLFRMEGPHGRAD
jgi:hypothetical protein